MEGGTYLQHDKKSYSPHIERTCLRRKIIQHEQVINIKHTYKQIINTYAMTLTPTQNEDVNSMLFTQLYIRT